jgi:hypothetical protein
MPHMQICCAGPAALPRIHICEGAALLLMGKSQSTTAVAQDASVFA